MYDGQISICKIQFKININTYMKELTIYIYLREETYNFIETEKIAETFIIVLLTCNGIC